MKIEEIAKKRPKTENSKNQVVDIVQIKTQTTQKKLCVVDTKTHRISCILDGITHPIHKEACRYIREVMKDIDCPKCSQ